MKIVRLFRAVCSASGPGAGGGDPESNREQGQALVLEKAKPRLRRPRLYKVLLLNDDYTPMEFVVQVLKTFFSKDPETASRIMLEVHTRGCGLGGIYTHEIAETKVAQVLAFSHEHEHPLMCRTEPSDEGNP